MKTTVKAHSRSVKGKGNRPVRRHTRTKGAEDLKPRKKRGFMQRVMDALTPYSPVMLNKEKERSERIQAARKAAEFKRTNERYHVKNRYAARHLLRVLPFHEELPCFRSHTSPH
jgi:hypothetical protein